MKNKRGIIVATWILAVLPLVLCLAAFPFLPERIPMHWDVDGTVAYQGKGSLLGMAALSPLLAAMLFALPKIDPKKDNYSRFSKYYSFFGIFLMAFLLVCDLIVLSESFFPGRISVGTAVQALVGVLLLFVGNMMPKIKSNFFMGLKNPWTLSSPDVWNRAHRLAGALLFLTGLVILLTCFWLPPAFSFWLIGGMGVLSVLVPTVLSYIWYQRLPKQPNEKEEKS